MRFNIDTKNANEANKITNKILEQQKKLEELNSQEYIDKEKVVLAQSNKAKDEKIEKMEDEQKTLRGMASSGIVIASFTHELGNLADKLSTRMDDLKMLFSRKIPENIFKDEKDYMNPYILMEDMKKQDNKLNNWLKFSLASARKDKRKRKINLVNYFEGFKQSWSSVFFHRQINFEINILKEDIYEMRVFEIDIDSIFNNLLVNSIEAMEKTKKNEIL